MTPLAMLAEARDALVGAVGTVVVGLVVAGVAGLVRWLSSATRREGASDVTTASLATSLARMESKLDALTAGHAEGREARVRLDARLDTHGTQITELKDAVAAVDARVADVDKRQTDARHALRNELHGIGSKDLADAILKQAAAVTLVAEAAQSAADAAREIANGARGARRG